MNPMTLTLLPNDEYIIGSATLKNGFAFCFRKGAKTLFLGPIMLDKGCSIEL